MQKVYVLLRNDQQTGPYSLDEIIQFDLKPYDLIWIEGKSAGWYYPQEIAALHPHLPFLPQKPKPVAQTAPAEKKVFVAMPIAPKQEETPVVPPLYEAPSVSSAMEKPVVSSSKNFEEEIYAQFKTPVAEKEAVAAMPVATKKKNKNRSIAVAFATVLVVGGVFTASWMMNRHSNDEETSAGIVSNAPAQAELTNAAVANNDKTPITQAAFVTKQKKEKNNQPTTKKVMAAKPMPLPQESQKITANHSPETNTNEDASSPTNEEKPAVTEQASTAPAETTAAPQEKKKKLRDKIFDIFRKKPDEQKTEEAKPAETENGERRSTHREDGASLAQLVSIRFDVPNDWMMGIKGAKATLVNRSNQTVSKAVVDVLYYDDDNNVLQKKTIVFGKIEAKESKTVSIPDHSSATKVDYNIVSVEGRPGA